MKNGKDKRNFKQVFYKLGVIKYANEDSDYSSSGISNKQSRSIFCIKSIFYGLLVFYTLFAFTNKVSAYDLFNSPSNYSNITIKSIEDFISDYNIDTTLDNDISYYLTHYSYIIIIPYELNDKDYFLLRSSSSSAPIYILDSSYDSNYSNYETYPLGFTCSTFNRLVGANFTSISASTYSENPYVIRNANYSLDDNTYIYHYNTNSSSTYSFSDTIYTNYEYLYYLDSEGTSVDLLSINNNTEPTEPTNTIEPTEPTNTTEPTEPTEGSDDSILTNNLLYYIAFITTLGVLYNMIRNTFKRSAI